MTNAPRVSDESIEEETSKVQGLHTYIKTRATMGITKACK